MTSLAALLPARRSWYSLCSSLRCSVASATDLSSSEMPFCRAAISSSRVLMLSVAVAMAVSLSEMRRSSAFFSSSVLSNCAAQYTFLLSSSVCSVFRVTTISSIILMTLSKPIFLPDRASMMMSSFGLLRLAFWIAAMAASALERMSLELTCTCTKLALELGMVFLKRSRASSSFRILMVSASATSSSARSFSRSAISAAFEPQLVLSSAWNFLSSISPFAASERPALRLTISTPSSPSCFVLDSIAAVRADSSLVLAAIRSLKALMAASSSATTSPRSLSMVSFIWPRMPRI
mmetsp:Transcript_72343/g.156400  ORF Transcript_72343/g.156400 Transcript_72343/m.156400 type:complete len:293 (-) Transcript_72343:462-1340(-)